MPMTVAGTGPYNFNGVSGISTQTSFVSYFFFSGQLSPSDTYQSSGSTIMTFGTVLSELVMINNGTTDIAFQWYEGWGSSLDHGVVLANSTIVLRRCLKKGIKVRCAETGQSGSFLCWGV